MIKRSISTSLLGFWEKMSMVRGQNGTTRVVGHRTGKGVSVACALLRGTSHEAISRSVLPRLRIRHFRA